MQLPTSGFRLESAHDSISLLLADPLTPELLREIGPAGSCVTEIWTLWRRRTGDISLLQGFRNLERLHIINRTAFDIHGIANLHNLRVLTVQSDSFFDADPASWPLIEELSVPWGPKLVNLWRAPLLTTLRVFSWGDQNLQVIGTAPYLRELELIGGPLRTLSGLERCNGIKNLTLSHLRKLDDFTAISSLKSLRDLRIQTCRKLKSVDVITNLPKLECLHLDNVGNIASLNPLRTDHNLKELYFTDSTNVLDGNTAIVNEMKLENFAFQNRKHYNYNYNKLWSKLERDSHRFAQ